MSKKDAAIYLRAAELQATDGSAYSCNSIDLALHGGYRNLGVSFSALATRYSATFRPTEEHPLHEAWGFFWYESAQECRILALCFAAAMAEAGDL